MTTISEETTVEVIPGIPSFYVTVEQKALVNALTALAPAVPKRPSLPILSNVKIEASTLGVKLAATNLELYMSTRLPLSTVHVRLYGACTTNYKEFVALVKPLKGQFLTLSFQDEMLTVETAHLTVTLATLPVEEYPADPKGLHEKKTWAVPQTLTLPVATLRHAVSMVEYAASNDFNRPVFTAIRMKLSQDVLDLAAADQKRMSIMREQIEGAGTWNVDLLLPVVSLCEVLKKLPKAGDVTLSAASPVSATLTCGPIVAHLRQVEGTYPNVEVVIPREDADVTTVLVERAVLKQALETVASIVKDSGKCVHLHFMQERIEVKAQRDEMKEPMVVQVPAEATGQEMEVIFHWRNVMDIVQASSYGSLQFHLQSPHHAVRITIPECPGFVGVTMPMNTHR